MNTELYYQDYKALNLLPEIVNALELCAEQCRLFMELHTEDEDLPVAYDAYCAAITKYKEI